MCISEQICSFFRFVRITAKTYSWNMSINWVSLLWRILWTPFSKIWDYLQVWF
jgi:hypothetical protein